MQIPKGALPYWHLNIHKEDLNTTYVPYMWFECISEMHMEHLASLTLTVFFFCVVRAKQIANENMSSGAHCAERACLGEINVKFVSLLSPFDRTTARKAPFVEEKSV